MMANAPALATAATHKYAAALGYCCYPAGQPLLPRPLIKTIFRLEDDAASRKSLAELLELAGYGVHAAPNGQVGLALALAHAPDLVLCNIRLPVLNGYGVLAHFTQHPRLAGAPFIFFTTTLDPADQRRAMALGADDYLYLTQPLAEAELLGAIAGRLARFRVYEAEEGLFFANHSLDQLRDKTFAHLLTYKNVLVTGHQAYLTREALTNIADATVACFDAWDQGRVAGHEL